MLIYQTPANANAVLDALAAGVNADTSAYRVAVAYVTTEGARTLVETLAGRMGPAWKAIPRVVVTCFDFGHTEPKALEFLQASGFVVRIANIEPDGRIRVAAIRQNFHPKVYLADGRDGVYAVVGSANLSRRALRVNTEAVSIARLPTAEVTPLWEAVLRDSAPLTPELLGAYRAARPTQRPPRVEDEPPIPPEPPARKLRVFRDDVESQAIDPAQFQAFWIEVGSPSGGSANQLELPRRANTFFGYSFDEYDELHHLIGEPLIMTARGSWPCRLTWHGNNRMERINLPTTRNSGLVYRNQIVLFQRSGSAFSLVVAPPRSALALGWREESAAANALFRISEGSARRCGLV